MKTKMQRRMDTPRKPSAPSPTGFGRYNIKAKGDASVKGRVVKPKPTRKAKVGSSKIKYKKYGY